MIKRNKCLKILNLQKHFKQKKIKKKFHFHIQN